MYTNFLAIFVEVDSLYSLLFLYSYSPLDITQFLIFSIISNLYFVKETKLCSRDARNYIN